MKSSFLCPTLHQCNISDVMPSLSFVFLAFISKPGFLVVPLDQYSLMFGYCLICGCAQAPGAGRVLFFVDESACILENAFKSAVCSGMTGNARVLTVVHI